MKKELQTALEGLNDKEIEAVLEDAKAIKEGKDNASKKYDETIEKKKRDDSLKQLKEVSEASAFMAKAKMPIKFKDDDLGFGEGEYDVREISAKTKRQLDYRFDCMEVNLLRDTAQSLRDMQRLMLLMLKKMGVDDVQEELDNLLIELDEKYRHTNA